MKGQLNVSTPREYRERLPKAKIGKCCVTFKRLADLDEEGADGAGGEAEFLYVPRCGLAWCAGLFRLTSACVEQKKLRFPIRHAAPMKGTRMSGVACPAQSRGDVRSTFLSASK